MNIEEVSENVEGAVRRLAANIMRSSRGSGNVHQIIADAANYLKACEVYKEVTGQWPASSQVSEALQSWRGQKTSAVGASYEMMASGALQMVASRLLGQIPQTGSGENELSHGARCWEKAVAENRDRRQSKK